MYYVQLCFLCEERSCLQRLFAEQWALCLKLTMGQQGHIRATLGQQCWWPSISASPMSSQMPSHRSFSLLYFPHRKFLMNLKSNCILTSEYFLVIIDQQKREVLILKIRNSIEASLNVWDLHEEHMEVG